MANALRGLGHASGLRSDSLRAELEPVMVCHRHVRGHEVRLAKPRLFNTKGYSSTYLAMGFAGVRAGTQKRRGVLGYPPKH